MGGQEGTGVGVGDNYFMGVENGVEWNGVGCLAGGQGRLGAVLGMGGSGSAGRQPWKRRGVPRAVGRSPHKKPDKKPGGKR